MGIAAGLGVAASGLPAATDQANGVVSGVFAAVGASQPFPFLGTFNVSIWASYNTTLTTTAGSTAATVASAGAIAAGCNINGANVPLGTTVLSITGTAVVLALPSLTLQGHLRAGGIISGLKTTAGLVGAAVSGPGVPAGATVSSIITPAIQSPSFSNGVQVDGIVQLSNTATSPPTSNLRQQFTFALTGSAVSTGADAAALFTGTPIMWSASLQLERSFDGGRTFLIGNTNLNGSLAQWGGGPAINAVFIEPEKGVLYRLNCTGYASGVINYRMSVTGGAAQTLSPGSNF